MGNLTGPTDSLYHVRLNPSRSAIFLRDGDHYNEIAAIAPPPPTLRKGRQFPGVDMGAYRIGPRSAGNILRGYIAQERDRLSSLELISDILLSNCKDIVDFYKRGNQDRIANNLSNKDTFMKITGLCNIKGIHDNDNERE